MGNPLLKESKGPGKTYDYVDRDPFGIIRFHYLSLGKFQSKVSSEATNDCAAALRALRIVVDEEIEHASEAEQSAVDLRRKEATQPLQRLQKRERLVKQELEVQDYIKGEKSVEGHEHEDSDDMTVLESRSCKRPRNGQEVIVLE